MLHIMKTLSRSSLHKCTAAAFSQVMSPTSAPHLISSFAASRLPLAAAVCKGDHKRESNWSQRVKINDETCNCATELRAHLINISALAACRFDERMVVAESSHVKWRPAANTVFYTQQLLSAELYKFQNRSSDSCLVRKMRIKRVVLE
jgi:hypothetical protein